MIQEYKDYPANGMTYKKFVHPRPRSKFFYVLNLCNNFCFGFAFGVFFWVLPFFDMVKIIGDSIALHCGVK